MNRSRKVLLTTLVVGATSAVAGLGVFAAFTAQTSTTGNSISSGTVNITDNDAGGFLYNVINQGPGATTTKCIKVTYSGNLPATVKLYRSGPAISNGTLFNVAVERGSGLGAFGSCTGFVSAGTVFTGTLAAFPTTYASAPDARGSAWAQNDVVDYRFTVTVVDDPTPGMHTTPNATGSHDFTWEAQNN